MKTLTLELPDEVLAAVRTEPSRFVKELRVAAAVTWYREGRVSQEIAAQVAGLDRTDFLLELARLGESSFGVDFEDLDRELAHG